MCSPRPPAAVNARWVLIVPGGLVVLYVGQAVPDIRSVDNQFVRHSLTYGLVAVAGEGDFYLLGHGGAEGFGAAEFADSLLILARSEMARARRAVLDLSVGRN